MTPERWNVVESLLDEMLGAGPFERARLLESTQDAEIRAEVESLLEAHEASESFLDGSAADVAAPLLASVLSGRDEAPHLIGERWRILMPIGHGGMGTVYLAERADGHHADSGGDGTRSRKGGRIRASPEGGSRRIRARLRS